MLDLLPLPVAWMLAEQLRCVVIHLFAVGTKQSTVFRAEPSRTGKEPLHQVC